MASMPAANRLPAIMRDTIVGLVRRDGADLSARQLSVLLICFLEDGPHTVRGLAERLNVAKPAITRALDRLEQFDLVRRAPDPRDRRSVLVSRTAPGASYVAHLRGLMQTAAKAYGAEFKPLNAHRAASG
jgi:DNA-binding MarR family transcriptional regulator